MQEDRVRVYLVYALAAIIVIATTVLGALGRLSSDQMLSILRDVLLSLGWWHAQAPRGAAPAAPTPAPAVPLWLALLLLPTVACHAEWSLFEPPGAPRAGAAQAALGAPSSATQINFDTSAVPLSCPASKGCLAVNAVSGRLYFHGTDAVNIEIGQLAPGAAVPAAQLAGQVPAANLTTALGAPPAIGGTTAAAGTFTTVTATSQFTGPGTGLTALPAAQLTGLVAQARGGLGADVSSSIQNCVLAGPTSGAGPITCRFLVAGDLPATSGGITMATLIFDAVAFGDGLASAGIATWQAYDGDYTYGAVFQALSPIVVSGVKARSAAASGTLTVAVWVGVTAVTTGSTTISGVGNYSVSVNPYTITAGTIFTVSAYEGTKLPHYDYRNIAGGAVLNSVVGTLVAPSARIVYAGVYGSGGAKPVTPGSDALAYGAGPIFSTP